MFDPIQICYSKRTALWGLVFGVVISLMIFSSPSAKSDRRPAPPATGAEEIREESDG